MNISVVIPTCNRRSRLLLLLKNLNSLIYPLREVIIIDSGEEALTALDYTEFSRLAVRYVRSEKSVCVQRNMGIRLATSEWILLCDDDLELPVDYLNKLAEHIAACPDTGAVSGIVLQKVDGKWEGKYNERSALMLCWKYLFQLSIWGEITCRRNFVTRRINKSYSRKGNHLSKAGWPVLLNFSGDYFTTPVYALGASLIKREWLMKAPFDEVLDRHGIGDHYGVAVKFPSPVHVLNSACVFHHQETANRLNKRLQYYRRVLALDYFVTTNTLRNTSKVWLLWSLFGNFLYFLFSGQGFMIWPACKAFSKILVGKNPYQQSVALNTRITEPLL